MVFKVKVRNLLTLFDAGGRGWISHPLLVFRSSPKKSMRSIFHSFTIPEYEFEDVLTTCVHISTLVARRRPTKKRHFIRWNQIGTNNTHNPLQSNVTGLKNWFCERELMNISIRYKGMSNGNRSKFYWCWNSWEFVLIGLGCITVPPTLDTVDS